MGEIRIPKKGSKYWLPKQQFLTAFHYCQQFPDWEKDYRQLVKEAGISAVPSGRTPRGSDAGDPTGAAAVRLAEIERKMKIIRDTAQEVAPEISFWLLEGVTKNRPFWYLHDVMHMPCERDMYYDRRRKFYYLMAKRI